jgi:hypothetical protein
MEQGWVYVLVNPSMPGLAKVGRTSRLPHTRAAELSGATGVATPFILVFEQIFRDCIAAERDIHIILDRCDMRYSSNREFFRGPTTEIIRLVLQYAVETGDVAVMCPQQSGLDLLAQGDKFLFGDLETFQDLSEALRCYQLAAARGSLVAFERLGAIIAQIHGSARGGRTRAMGYLREGAKRGNYYCYCEMALMAADDGNVGNFIKAWELFFVHRQAAVLHEVEAGQFRYVATLQRYLVACFRLNTEPTHAAAMRGHGDALMKMLHQTRSMARLSPNTRRHVARAQRWTKQVLVGAPCAQPQARQSWTWLPVWAEKWRDAPA